MAVGTAQGLGAASLTALAHRAMHAAPPPAKLQQTTTNLEKASVVPALRELNARLVRGLIGRACGKRGARRWECRRLR